MKKAILSLTVVALMATGCTALATNHSRPMGSGFHPIVSADGMNGAEPEWIASGGNRTFFASLQDIEGAFPNPNLDRYEFSVIEKPTYYYLRDVMISEREAAGLSTDDYDDFAYSLVTYRLDVQRKAPVEGYVIRRDWVLANSTYTLTKLTQIDYTEDGSILDRQAFTPTPQVAAPGSDEYELAHGLDEFTYYYRPAGR